MNKNLRISGDFTGLNLKIFLGEHAPGPLACLHLGNCVLLPPLHHWLAVMPYPQLCFAGSMPVEKYGRVILKIQPVFVEIRRNMSVSTI